MDFSSMSDEDFQGYGFQNASSFDYRIELAHRISRNFNADHLIIFDDVALTVSKSERATSFVAVQGCDRSLLPALWLAAGFQHGATILLYTPPNPIELREYLRVKHSFEQRLKRSIRVRMIWNCIDVLQIYENNVDQYIDLCRESPKTRKEFYDEFHIDQLKENLQLICADAQRSFVFPFETMHLHHRALSHYPQIVLADVPTIDKAKHNLLLRQHHFTELPNLLMIFIDGTIIDDYDAYLHAMSRLSTTDTAHHPDNVQRFARSIVTAIDRMHNEYSHEKVFLKLDANGAGGWSCVSPTENPLLYDWSETFDRRVDYLISYIEKNVLEDHLPSHAIVEEFIHADIRPGNIAADYTVCGFVLNAKFYPTSINLCATDSRGQYIEQWTAAQPEQIGDDRKIWQKMFLTYAKMVAIEAEPFSYRNGIYAGDLFVTSDHQLKQRDWNIRRGGRSTPETLIMLNEPNYETKINVKIKENLSWENLFDIYTNVCDRLSRPPYSMYPFSTSFCYFSKLAEPNFLRINILINPEKFRDENGEILAKEKHRRKYEEILRDYVADELKKY